MGSQPEQEDSVISKFLQYRDGGKTDEKGISTHLYGLFQGQVSNGLAVTQDSPLGMSVAVSKGRCMIDSGDDYPYLGFTDTNEAVTITAADGSNPRIDAIVAYVDLSVVDSTNSNNPGAFEIVAVAGTPAGSPNPPNDGAISTAIGLGNPFIRLAHVTVGAGVTTITTGNVSDQRVFVGLPDGFIRSSDTLAQGVVKNINLNTDTGELGGEWQDFTPSWTGLSGGTLSYAKYLQIGKTVFFDISITLTGSNISGEVRLAPPISMNSRYDNFVSSSNIGNGQARDTSAGVTYILFVVASNNLLYPLSMNTTGSNVARSSVNANTPFTWANTDVLTFSGVYEAA